MPLGFDSYIPNEKTGLNVHLNHWLEIDLAKQTFESARVDLQLDLLSVMQSQLERLT